MNEVVGFLTRRLLRLTQIVEQVRPVIYAVFLSTLRPEAAVKGLVMVWAVAEALNGVRSPSTGQRRHVRTKKGHSGAEKEAKGVSFVEKPT